MEKFFSKNQWALILGASSGFGGATAVELARRGMSIFGVHLDRAATQPNAEKIENEIKDNGAGVRFFNVNASDESKRNEVLDTIQKEFEKDSTASLRVILHSLAFGTLKPFVMPNPSEMLTKKQMEMTLDVMASSLVYWVQGAFARKLLKPGARVLAMTSSGGHSVIPDYGAVSAAKAALESNIRQLAMELGPHGITASSIMAGVTNTPALQRIPSGSLLLKYASQKNPRGRSTTTEDVAKVISLLARDEADWISGGVIAVDGGEDVAMLPRNYE
ncbi:MAG: SDR family oxidoreductase [Bacteroidota bacterium]